MCRRGLLEAARSQPHRLGIALADVGDLGVAHQVEPPTHARSLARRSIEEVEPLIVPERVETFLDAHGLGVGPLTTTRIGDGGGSNFTFLLERGDERFVLRRPPRPPLLPSAHDMVREAGLQNAMREAGFGRLAEIVAVCADESVLGVPFYVMRFLAGDVITTELPSGLETEAARRSLGMDLVDTLVEIHAADVSLPPLAAFARPGSYAERQVRRFSQLWEINKTRELSQVDEVGRFLADHLPPPLEPTVVHGDYRLGNMMVAPGEPTRIAAVLDWEMGAIGDPRADVGYLLATYSEPGGRTSALGSTPVTAEPGFPSRAELVDRYAERSGREVEPLAWFEALALWKAAVFCEAIYGRFIRGELGAEDTRAAIFEAAVPLLAETALAAVAE
ncbi:MAG: phosphotransferase family protein [Actinobacteria bacterium]|nr:phosphotransferase family protein [Actinomycetota bacterium]